MAERITTTTNIPEKKVTVSSNPSIFTRENYIWMIAGALVITIGMFLMAGGKSDNPAVFNKDEVYSFRRITLAPILILAGLIIEIFAIFRKSKA